MHCIHLLVVTICTDGVKVWVIILGIQHMRSVEHGVVLFCLWNYHCPCVPLLIRDCDCQFVTAYYCWFIPDLLLYGRYSGMHTDASDNLRCITVHIHS